MRLHWNTWKTRQAANDLIRMQFSDSHHWFPKGSEYECTADDLDLCPFVIVLEAGTIVSVAIPKIAYDQRSAEIVVLATHPNRLGNGYGKSAVHVALTYIIHQCPSCTFGLWADTFVGEDGKSAVEFWEHLGMKRDESKTQIEDHEDGKTRTCYWMDGDIEDMLERIGHVKGSGCIIDAGSFCAIRKKPGHPFELRYCYEKYSWSMYGIKDVPGLNSDDPRSNDYSLSEGPLRSMGISVADVKSAIEKRGRPVKLRAGKRIQERSFWKELEEGTIDVAEHKLLFVKFPQLDLLEEDLTCVIKAAASGIFRHDQQIAEQIMRDYGRNVDPSQMKDIRIILREVGVQSDFVFGTEGVDGQFFLNLEGGLFLTTIIDQNGTGGHCVFIDVGRKVIIDPANKKEISLNLRNLFECAGPCSLTLAFCRVLEIHLPDRNRKEDKTRAKRKRKREKKRLESSSMLPRGGECFSVKVDGEDHVFQRGLMSMPIELSQTNYQRSFNELQKVGMICRTTSAPMTILGSTIGASLNELIFVDGAGKRRNLPRRNSKCREGSDGFHALKKSWLVNITNQSDAIAHDFALITDSRLLALLHEAKRIIPDELRISGSCFTGLALVGSCNADHGKDEYRQNHPHRDSNDVISLFVTLGDDSVTGGRTVYYDVNKSFSRKNPFKTSGKVVAHTKFVHGQYQIGPFERVVHGGEVWHGPRVLMSYFLNLPMLEHFRKYGRKPYDEQLADQFK